MAQAPSRNNVTTGGDFPVNVDSFARHIRAENPSPATLDAYVEAAYLFYRPRQGETNTGPLERPCSSGSSKR